MKADPILNKAAILARKRDYEGAFKILKDEEDRYNGSFKYYNLYGIICLHAGNFVEAHEFLQYAKQKNFKDVSTLLGLAVLYLKRPNTVQAVDYYLDVLEKDPGNKIAKKALDVIRKQSDAEALSDWMTPDRLSKLFPPIPANVINQKTIITGVCALALVVILVFGVLVAVKALPNPFKTRSERLIPEYALSRQDRNETLQESSYNRYVLTDISQAIDLYDKALSLFTAYRDEAAKVSINLLLESNAPALYKNKARLLLENMEAPGFDNFQHDDNHSYSAVLNEPLIYRNVYVIWRGMAANIRVTEGGTSFDLMVGYDTRVTLEGIVAVDFDKPVAINTERPIEVLGKIVVSSVTDFSLEGAAVHQSGRLENW